MFRAWVLYLSPDEKAVLDTDQLDSSTVRVCVEAIIGTKPNAMSIHYSDNGSNPNRYSVTRAVNKLLNCYHLLKKPRIHVAQVHLINQTTGLYIRDNKGRSFSLSLKKVCH